MINCVYCGYDDNFGKLICKNCSDGLITKTKSANKHDKQRKAQADDLTHTNHTEGDITQIMWAQPPYCLGISNKCYALNYGKVLIIVK